MSDYKEQAFFNLMFASGVAKGSWPWNKRWDLGLNFVEFAKCLLASFSNLETVEPTVIFWIQLGRFGSDRLTLRLI